jgi:hypothetical protein
MQNEWSIVGRPTLAARGDTPRFPASPNAGAGVSLRSASPNVNGPEMTGRLHAILATDGRRTDSRGDAKLTGDD